MKEGINIQQAAAVLMESLVFSDHLHTSVVLFIAKSMQSRRSFPTLVSENFPPKFGLNVLAPKMSGGWKISRRR